MKKATNTLVKNLQYVIFLVLLLALFLACNSEQKEDTPITPKEEIPAFKDIYWRINAIHPDGSSIVIKAIDSEGNLFDVFAIQNSEQHSFLNIKAMVNDKKLPVKMLLSENAYAPVKAIDRGGISYEIKAVTDDGEKLAVKGITQFGNIISLKAINEEGDFYGVKAISPDGLLNDVKGVKINNKEKEMSLNGFSVFAHVKAMHQSKVALKEDPKQRAKKNKKSKKKKKEKKPILWNINAVTLTGENLAVKAVDTLGNSYDIKAIQNSAQESLMNVHAFVKESELPVKILVSTEEFSPILAIDRYGNTYEIKVMDASGNYLDVKGTNRMGNIVNIKAIASNGEQYGIKAFSPDGKLNDVKGIKIFDRDKEQTLRGNEIYAHIKAITQ